MIEAQRARATILIVILCTVPITGCVDGEEGSSRYVKIYVENNDNEDANFRIQVAQREPIQTLLPATSESPNVKIAGELNLTQATARIQVQEAHRELHEEATLDLHNRTYVIVRLESNDTLSIQTSSSEPLFD